MENNQDKVGIYEILSRIQGDLHVPKIVGNAKFLGGTKFRNAEAIMTKLKPLLKENKASVIVEHIGFHKESIGTELVGESGNVKTTYKNYLILRLTFCYQDEKDARDYFVAIIPKRDNLDEAQTFGCTLSYGIKYVLGYYFLVDDGLGGDTIDVIEAGQKQKGDVNANKR